MQLVPKKRPLLLQHAKVLSLAKTEGSDAKIVDQIRKCLEGVQYSNTTELEAGLQMSSRLVSQHNVTQAEVFARADTSERMAQLGDQSIVQIDARRDEGRAIHQTWVYDLGFALQVFFDCKSYTTDGTSYIEWTFYGIRANTVAAAMSFNIIHNLILEWSRLKKGIDTRDDYCLDIVHELHSTALRAKQREEDEAMEKEQTDSIIRLEQEKKLNESKFKALKTIMGVVFDAYEEMPTTFKEKEKELNNFENLETSLNSIMARLRNKLKSSGSVRKVKDEPLQNQVSANQDRQASNSTDDNAFQSLTAWGSLSALILFRRKANSIADEYLRSKNVKLPKASPLARSHRELKSYRQGQKACQKIKICRT